MKWIVIVLLSLGSVTLMGAEGCFSNTFTALRYPLETPPRIVSQDGAGMVLVPAGAFSMGSAESQDELPIHTVHIDAFYMDTNEVTNAQYREFLLANEEWRKSVRDWRHDGNYLKDWDGLQYPQGMWGHPVAWVTWYAAEAYCSWAGKRLPTEAEWEKAARGGLAGARYPLGDALWHDDANFAGVDGKDIWYSRAPVASFPPNLYSLYDMAGNVSEWCADWYDGGYYASCPDENPQGPGTGFNKVLRGGAFFLAPYGLRVAERSSLQPTITDEGFGFRCAQDLVGH